MSVVALRYIILIIAGLSIHAIACQNVVAAVDEPVLDTIKFGDSKSEKAHRFSSRRSEVIKGGLGVSARRLMPRTKEHWRGHRMVFRMKVHPRQPNYFTAKFWGGEELKEASRLHLFIDGKQVGQRHLGDIDPLDIAGDDPRYPGRFFYKTVPLPPHITWGKREIEFAIEVHGWIWGYGNTFEVYQRSLEHPSRGIYRGYTHTNPFISPGKDETQGSPPEDRIRTEPGEEIVEEFKKGINHNIRRKLRSESGTNQEGVQFLANAYLEPWTDAYQNEAVLQKVVQTVDEQCEKYRKDPSIFEKEWEGAGPTADAVQLLEKELQPFVDKPVPGGGKNRRDAWTEMFAASRDWHVQNRRSYTNQTMIVDLNIYLCNRAVNALLPKRAWPEKKARGLLYEAVGIDYWKGSWNEKGKPDYAKGKRYTQLTEKGLTKELGYVGEYGEIVQDIVKSMYEATRADRNSEGDSKIREQLIKMSRARAVFRYPHLDKDGFRCMRLETVVGWRDTKYPSVIVYGQRPLHTGGPLDVAAATDDPVLTGWGQQMVEDNQFFALWKHLGTLGGEVTNHSMMRLPRIYDWLKKQPARAHRLPMSNGQPNFVFADPEAGVIAIKQGDDIIYVSLYWRARYSINNLARVHHLSPQIERDAIVYIQSQYTKSNLVYTIPDVTNFGFGKKFEGDYKKEGMNLATAGLKQPVARVPPNIKDFKPGKESIHAGKANLYVMTYGPYFIAMNCHSQHSQKSYPVDIPREFKDSRNLVSGEFQTKSKARLKAGETMVLFLGDKED